MNWLEKLFQIVRRFKHPVSLPEDVGKDLGIRSLDNELSFRSCVRSLTNPKQQPSNLWKFMKRSEAELQFSSALKKEYFRNNSLFSYYMFHGWLSFDLIFDENNQLRRLYVQHKRLCSTDDERLEIGLKR